MTSTSDCKKCGAPRGLIGWMCDCWYDSKPVERPKANPKCKHKFVFELADVELLQKIVKWDWKDYQEVFFPCEKCGGNFEFVYKTLPKENL